MGSSAVLCGEQRASRASRASRVSASSGPEDVEHAPAITPSRRSLSWERKEPRAILYDPSKQALSTFSITSSDRKSPWSCGVQDRCSIQAETSDKIKVHLPPWRNRVDIYLDEKAREGFVATVNLNRLGSTKNWQRRLRRNYTSLYVRGEKPGDTSRASSISTTPGSDYMSGR